MGRQLAGAERSPPLCSGLIKALFHGLGKTEEEMEEFRIEHRGKQITGLAVMRMDEGILSRPAERRGLKEERVSSHHA